jgi:hypothetical protein
MNSLKRAIMAGLMELYLVPQSPQQTIHNTMANQKRNMLGIGKRNIRKTIAGNPITSLPTIQKPSLGI